MATRSLKPCFVLPMRCRPGGEVQSGGAASRGALLLRIPDRHGIDPPGDVRIQKWKHHIDQNPDPALFNFPIVMLECVFPRCGVDRSTSRGRERDGESVAELYRRCGERFSCAAQMGRFVSATGVKGTDPLGPAQCPQSEERASLGGIHFFGRMRVA